MSVLTRRPLAREALLSAVVGAALAGLLIWLGPPGVDLAAHSYQRTFLLQHGFALWNNFWYAGRYSFVTYSFIYYPLAAVLGITVLAIASIATAALAFTLVVWHEWGERARLSSRPPPPPLEPCLRRPLDRDRALRGLPVRARDGPRAALGQRPAARPPPA